MHYLNLTNSNKIWIELKNFIIFLLFILITLVDRYALLVEQRNKFWNEISQPESNGGIHLNIPLATSPFRSNATKAQLQIHRAPTHQHVSRARHILSLMSSILFCINKNDYFQLHYHLCLLTQFCSSAPRVDSVHSWNNKKKHMRAAAGVTSIRQQFLDTSILVCVSNTLHAFNTAIDTNTRASVVRERYVCLCDVSVRKINIFFWFHSPWECYTLSFVAVVSHSLAQFNLRIAQHAKGKMSKQCHELYEMYFELALMFHIFAYSNSAVVRRRWRHGFSQFIVKQSILS